MFRASMTGADRSRSGDRLRELRLGLGVSRVALVRRSGVSARTLQRWEARGLESARVLDVVRVAWALGVPAVELVPALAADPLRPGFAQDRAAEDDRAADLVAGLRAQVAGPRGR